MVEYLIVEASMDWDLVEKVTAKIALGFHPIGGVAVIRSDEYHYIRFYQAMIKEPDLSSLKRKLKTARKKGWSLESVFAGYIDEMINDEDQS